MISDNGSNFVAAKRELRQAVEQLKNSELADHMTAEGIEWKFNPPRAPHFGGVFERVVQSMKHVLQSILHKVNLTIEELTTAVVQAEGLLNSRPLTIISSDSDDLRPLTPLHFMVGHMKVTTPLELTEEDTRVHPCHRWRVVQQLLQEIWRRWVRELVPRMNVRTKWVKKGSPVNVGDVLMAMDDTAPRGKWPLGRVISVFPGKDGVVRVVEIKVNGKVKKRAVRCLIPLEVSAVGSHDVELPETGVVALDEVL